MTTQPKTDAVVPGYYLVCYNFSPSSLLNVTAVVPGYYLVCYNLVCPYNRRYIAVVPGYYLVCYNPYLSFTFQAVL